MASSKFTLIGFLNYNPNLFAGLTNLPDGIDRETLIQTIMMEGGEFEVVYPNPFMLQAMIPFWVDRYYKVMEKWAKAYNASYDPLYNYNRYDDWEEHDENNVKGTTKTETESTNDNTVTGKVSAYDSQDFSNRTQRIDDLSGTDTTEGEANTDSTGDSTHKGHSYGNIGVTTSQKMLADEYEVAKWDLYGHISDLFLDSFCIMVYE